MRGTSVRVERGGCAETPRSPALDAPTHREAGVVDHRAKSVPAAAPTTVAGVSSNRLLPRVREVPGRGAVTDRNPFPSFLPPHREAR